MSTEDIDSLPNPEEQKVVDPRPEDVKQLSKLAQEFAEMHKAAMEASFPGKASKVANMLIDHLYEMYQQSYNQLVVHPWVAEQRRLQAEAQAKASAQQGE